MMEMKMTQSYLPVIIVMIATMEIEVMGQFIVLTVLPLHALHPLRALHALHALHINITVTRILTIVAAMARAEKDITEITTEAMVV